MNIRVANLKLEVSKKDQEILTMSNLVKELSEESISLTNELERLKKSVKGPDQDSDNESDVSETERVAGVVQSLNLLKDTLKPSSPPNSTEEGFGRLMNVAKGLAEWMDQMEKE